MIHHLSSRAEHPFIDASCAAVPEDLIESELFGHEKGAFAGAGTRNIGKFELACRGTIFLDEIGEMTLKTQAKILRVLQEQKIQRIGGSRSIEVDARVIAASNKNLEKEIAKGRFREDLFYRLNVLPIEVPPLRQRIEDIPVLVDTFLKEFAAQNRSKQKKITPEALDILAKYSWPGNVRELKNLVDRLAIMVEGKAIDLEDIPAAYNERAGGITKMDETELLQIGNLKEAKLAFEKEFIIRKLAQYQNNVTQTAKAIGVGRSYLHKKIKSYK